MFSKMNISDSMLNGAQWSVWQGWQGDEHFHPVCVKGAKGSLKCNEKNND